MAIHECDECGGQLSSEADACPHCGHPSPSSGEGHPDEEEEQREVGLLLGLGIFFLPIIFAWFTLREGHSKKARFVALGWLAWTFIFAVTGGGFGSG